MNAHPARRARALTSALGAGLLALVLAACGGPGDGDGEATASPSASAPATSAGTEGTPSGEPSEVETALRTVLGEDARIVTGDRLQDLTESAQGVGGEQEVSPERCGREGLGGRTGELPEGSDLVGGIVVDTQDPASPASDMLSVTAFPDAAAASRAVADYEAFAEECPQYTVSMGEGMTAEATVDLTAVKVDADDALAMTLDTAVAIEGVDLPEGSESSSSTTLYVRDGERLITYAGTRAGGKPVPVEEGLEKVESLRTELDG